MALVLDTGPVLAALDADDPAHAPCAELLGTSPEPLVVVDAVLVEIDYWIRKKLSLDVWQSFLEDLEAGAYRLEHLEPADLLRAAALESKYADLELGFVDAAVIAVCERLGEKKVATLDARHFGAVRPAHCTSLTLLP
jgi:predicted nucleic acid-binding protein